MSDERDDRLIQAALGEGARGSLTPEERREADRLGAAFLALAAGAEPETPPPALKERLMAQVRADNARSLFLGRLAFTASFLLLAGWTALSLRPGPAVRISALSGRVLLNGRPAAAGQQAPEGAVLEAAPGAWADLRLDRRATMRLKDGGRLLLFRLRGAVDLRLELGGLFSHVRTGTAFSVRTPVTAAAVRGTYFYVRMEGADRAYVCLCQGKLRLTGPGGDKDLESAGHVAFFTGPGGMEPASLQGHTNEEAGLLGLDDR